MSSFPDFKTFFHALWEQDPFPWQQRLSDEVESSGWPAWLTLPTGTGKTAALDVAVYDLARQAERPMNERTAPVRIVFAVNRRIVVDEAYERARHIAEKLRQALAEPENILHPVALALSKLSGITGGLPLETYPLRGATFTDHSWARTPTQPLVITTTLDQLGSRLLFRGYGVSPNARPIHAALLANDALLILDEAHTAKAFSQTLEAVGEMRKDAHESIPLPFAAVQLTATPPASVGKTFSLGNDDRDHHIIRARLHASKPAELMPMVEGAKGAARHKKLADAMATKAISYLEAGQRRILIVVNRVATAEVLFAELNLAKTQKSHGPAVKLLTGRMRPLDRQELIGELTTLYQLKSSAPSADVPCLILIATQCIEVGADYDFDALITELAPLDSLRQRFGRLNRQGREIPAPAAIFAPEEVLPESEVMQIKKQILIQLNKILNDSKTKKVPVKNTKKPKITDNVNPLKRTIALEYMDIVSKESISTWLNEREDEALKKLVKEKLNWKFETTFCENGENIAAFDTINDGNTPTEDTMVTFTNRVSDLAERIAVAEPPIAKEPDPIYENCLPSVWAWLKRNSNAGEPIDFGLQGLSEIMPTGATLDAMLAPAPDAPILLGPHLDLFCQTSPEPHISPDPSLYIHGPGRSFPEVSVVLRADLTGKMDPAEMLKALPPIGTEAATVPLYLARQWLENPDKKLDDGGDVPQAVSKSDYSRGDSGVDQAFRWRDGEAHRLTKIEELTSGDVLVLPAQTDYLKLAKLFPAPEVEAWKLDQFENAHLLSRDRLAIRFHSGIRAELERLISNDEARKAFRILTEPLFAKDEDEGKWQFSETAWKNAISPLATLLAENLPAGHPWKELWTHAAWLKNEKQRPQNDWKIVPYPENTLDGVILFNRSRVGATPWPFDPADLGRQGSQAVDVISLADHSQAVQDRAESNAQGLPQVLADTLRDAGAWHDLGKLDPRFQAMLHGCGLHALAAKESIAKSGPRTLTVQQFLSNQAALPQGFRHELLSVLIVELSAAGREYPEHDLLLHLIASHHGRCRGMAPVIPDPQPEPFDVEVAGEILRFAGQDCPLAHLSQGVARRFWSLNRRFGWWGLPYLETLLRLADQYESANPNSSAQ